MTIKVFLFICLTLLTAALAGCPKPILKEEPPVEKKTTPSEVAPEENPRAAASLQLTDQGRRLIEAHQPDNAIRVLEQAVSLWTELLLSGRSLADEGLRRSGQRVQSAGRNPSQARPRMDDPGGQAGGSHCGAGEIEAIRLSHTRFARDAESTEV